MSRLVLVPIMASVLALGGGSLAAQTLALRQRVGNNTEDMTYVSAGRYAGEVVVVDGFDVIGIPPDAAPHTLFDTRGAGMLRAFGITYVPTTDRFYFGASVPNTDRLFVFDQDGMLEAPLPIQWPDPTNLPDVIDGLAYIPSSDPSFPDHIAVTASFPGRLAPRIEIIALDGRIDAEIVPAPGSVLDNYLTALAYVGPDRFAVYAFTGLPDQGIWLMDSGGRPVGSVPVVPASDPNEDIEGIALLPGRVATAEYTRGRVEMYDLGFQRLNGEDRPYGIGIGISSLAVTWNQDRGEFVFLSLDRKLYAVSAALDSKRLLVDLSRTPFYAAFGLSYLPGENLLAVTSQTYPRGVELFDASDGHYVSRISLDSFTPSTDWRVAGVAPLPGGRLALRIFTRPQLVQVITRAGFLVVDAFSDEYPDAVQPEAVGQVLLAADPLGFGLASFDTGKGLELLAGHRRFDADGSNPRLIDLSALGLRSGANGTFLSSGPYAGDFALLETGSSTIAIFSLP